MSQTIETSYILNGNAAKQELARLQAAEDKLGASSGRMAKGLSDFEVEASALQVPLQRLSASVGSVDGRVAAAEKSLTALAVSASTATKDVARVDSALSRNIGTLKGMQDGLGKSAGALAAMSSALAGGESHAAKFGQAAVGLVGTFVTGGPWLTAFAAATFAGEQLYATWRESNANGRIFRDAVDALAPSLHSLVEMSIDPARVATKGLLEDLRNFGKDTRQIAIDNELAVVQQLERRQSTLDKRLKDATAKRDAAGIGVAGNKFDLDQLETRQAIVDTLTARAEALPGEIADARRELEALTRAAGELDAKEAERDRARAAKAAAAKSANDPSLARVFSYDEFTAADDALVASNAKREQDRYDSLMREQQAEIDAANESVDINDKRNELMVASDQRRFEKQDQLAEQAAKRDAALLADGLQLAQSAASTLASTTQVYIESKIAGGEKAKYAEAAAAATALKGIGDQLVGFGVMQEFKAAAYAIDSGGFDPRAALLAGTGAAAIGAGLGMGAGAAAINASIPSGGGGGGSSARSTAGAGSGAASPSSSTTAPATTTINITYGGPTGRVAEDVAKDVEKSQRRNAKRGRR